MIYDDFMEMVNEIKNYIKKNPNAKIIVKDDSMTGLIGFEDADNKTRWEINPRRMFEIKDQDTREAIEKAYESTDGKEELVKSWYK